MHCLSTGSALVVLCTTLLFSCDRSRTELPSDNAAPSPNASIMPAPLVTDLLPAIAPPRAIADGAQGSTNDGQTRMDPSAPEPMRSDQPLGADTLSSKELSGVTLAGEWRWTDLPSPPKTPEINAEGVSAARRLTAFRWAVSMTDTGRLRITFDGRSWPSPLRTELRARVDRYGHVLVFPTGTDYRVVAPGALRAFFEDRRLDVLPLVSAEATSKGALPARHGYPVHRVEALSKLGSALIDFAKVPEAGLGAVLFCRTLMELLAVDPASATQCAREEVPVRAQFTWPGGGGIVFEAGEIKRQADFSASEFLCPPTAATFASSAMPPASGVFLTRDELGAFRSRPLETVSTNSLAPSEGVIAKNATDSLRYLLLDGVPVAWVMPGMEQYLPGLLKGRYTVQWRTFLADIVEPTRIAELPARLSLGATSPSKPQGEPIDAGGPPFNSKKEPVRP